MSESMKAVVITQPGGVEVLELRDVERPTPGGTDILVRVASSGLNRADLLQRRGLYPPPRGYPEDIPGLEYSGVIETIGEEVDTLAVGQAVMGITGGGAYAEYVVIPAATAVRIPHGLDPVEAGAIPEVFMTAYDAVFLQEGLCMDESLLVHAVGSGVGTATLQLALRAGAVVIGTSRTEAKLAAAAALGLEHKVLGDEVWPNRVLEITDGLGVNVILDLVGGAYLKGNQKVLASRGRHIVVGVPAGAKAEIDLRSLMVRRGSIRGTTLRARPHNEKVALARAFELEVLPGFEMGELKSVVDRVFPAGEAQAAHRYMEENRNFGKILLTW